MLKLCNIDIERREEIFKEIERFTDRLKDKFSIKEVYLYGSFATGEIHEGSDIDLVIVGDFTGRMFERIAEVLKLTDLPIEPLIYRPEEFERMKRGNSFIKNIVQIGKKMI